MSSSRRLPLDALLWLTAALLAIALTGQKTASREIALGLERFAGQISSQWLEAPGKNEPRYDERASGELVAGERFNADSGLYYLRARHYDPRTGRFASVDPFGGHETLPTSLHDYAYASGDPVGQRDPSGLMGLADFSTGMGVQGNLNAAGQVSINLVRRVPYATVYWGLDVNVAFLHKFMFAERYKQRYGWRYDFRAVSFLQATMPSNWLRDLPGQPVRAQASPWPKWSLLVKVVDLTVLQHLLWQSSVVGSPGETCVPPFYNLNSANCWHWTNAAIAKALIISKIK